MPDSTPPREALPDRFAIFPLSGVLLLPQGRLPLNMFEPRYKAMTEDALAGDGHIGMIQPLADASGAASPALHRVGCLGRLISFAEADDGRYLITLGGLIRFLVAEELPMTRGYRRVRADFSAFSGDLEPLEASQSTTGFDRAALYAAVRGYFARQDAQLRWETLDGLADAALVATLAMVCPFAPLERQALLEAPSFVARAETLIALLQIGTHGGADDPPRRPM
jgi:Lon protease-like protein